MPQTYIPDYRGFYTGPHAGAVALGAGVNTAGKMMDLYLKYRQLEDEKARREEERQLRSRELDNQEWHNRASVEQQQRMGDINERRLLGEMSGGTYYGGGAGALAGTRAPRQTPAQNAQSSDVLTGEERPAAMSPVATENTLPPGTTGQEQLMADDSDYIRPFAGSATQPESEEIQALDARAQQGQDFAGRYNRAQRAGAAKEYGTKSAAALGGHALDLYTKRNEIDKEHNELAKALGRYGGKRAKNTDLTWNDFVLEYHPDKDFPVDYQEALNREKQLLAMSTYLEKQAQDPLGRLIVEGIDPRSLIGTPKKPSTRSDLERLTSKPDEKFIESLAIQPSQTQRGTFVPRPSTDPALVDPLTGRSPYIFQPSGAGPLAQTTPLGEYRRKPHTRFFDR